MTLAVTGVKPNVNLDHAAYILTLYGGITRLEVNPDPVLAYADLLGVCKALVALLVFRGAHFTLEAQPLPDALVELEECFEMTPVAEEAPCVHSS